MFWLYSFAGRLIIVQDMKAYGCIIEHFGELCASYFVSNTESNTSVADPSSHAV